MRVKLEDVCERGTSNLRQSDVEGKTGAYPIYGAAGYIGQVDFYHQEKPYVAVVKDGAGIGRTTLLPAKSSIIGTMQYLLPKDNVLPQYLYYAVQYMHIEKYYTGATIPHIYYRDYKNEVFNLASIEQQRLIISTLSRVEGIISQRQRQLQLLDDLVKSRFIEMFGEPETNPFEWESCEIKDVMSAPASNGFFAKSNDYKPDGNVGIICVGDVVNRKYSNLGNLRRANADEKQLAKFKVKFGDILFCRSSLVKEGIAKASVIPEECGNNIVFECHVIRVPLNIKRVFPEFMQALSITDFFRGQMMEKSKTATMTTIGQKDVITGRIYVPPIELQKEFVLFSKQIDKSKLIIQQALDKAQMLYDSLMQKYFG